MWVKGGTNLTAILPSFRAHAVTNNCLLNWNNEEEAASRRFSVSGVTEAAV